MPGVDLWVHENSPQMNEGQISKEWGIVFIITFIDPPLPKCKRDENKYGVKNVNMH